MINLSNRPLTQHEVSVLSKGLSFIPSTKADPFKTRVELFKFLRNIKLRAFFDKGAPSPQSNSLQTVCDELPSTPLPTLGLRAKSTFVPPALNSSVATFCRLVEQDVMCKVNMINKNKLFSNIKPEESKALFTLSKDSNIVVRMADKGGAIVIQNKDAYRTEILRQLGMGDFYTPLMGDPTIKFRQEIDSFLSTALTNSLINQDEYNFMLQKHPLRPIFYTLPKIHKSCVEPVPGRPIVAGTQSLTEPISQYIDRHIKSMVSQLPSFLKDTTDFLNKLKAVQNFEKDSFLCTMDITSLYTNVPHIEGLEALTHFLNERQTRTPPTDFLVGLSRLILNRNYFKFENAYYLQCQGVSMGSPCSPNYANLFMGKFEEDFVYHNNPFLIFLKCWFRYIDDIFFIFNGSLTQLEEFKLYINSRMTSIKFSLEYSQETVSFLDVCVNKSDHLTTSVFRKKTDRNSFLNFSSYHPPSLKKGLPYSQLLRIRRICSTDAVFEEQAAELCTRFKAKGYSTNNLDDSLRKVRNLRRDNLLMPKTLVGTNKSNIVCATTFSPASQEIKKCILKYWHVLGTDPLVGHLYVKPPIFAHKRARNLRDVLVRADCYTQPVHFLSNLPNGNFPCSNCLQCNAMIRGETFVHPHSGKKFFIKNRICCRTRFVVYLLKCPCGLVYVGKTTRELRIRISEHKSNIRNKDEKSSVARHFNVAGHEVCSLRFQGIEVVSPLKRGGDRDRALLQRESYWIHSLHTEYPRGLNEELLLGCFL